MARVGAVRPSANRDLQVVQPSFDDLGTPLFDATFVVLDLETTGLRPTSDRITEVGAVKVKGGRVLGEFQCLVAPGIPIPAAVTALTGITEHMVAARPPVEAVLPSLMEFLRGAVLVAHNANFDVSFLQAAFSRLHYPRLEQPVVDTARLARRALDRSEVRDFRLETLATYLRARTRPEHRALADARATVDVLHGLLERVGSLGVRTLEDLQAYSRSTSDPAYRKISLVDDAPRDAGVYRFLDRRGDVLYVGKAVDLRSRLRRYFGQDDRRKVADLVRQTMKVEWELTPTEIEAKVREVRAIHRHRPRFNRRSRNPERSVYVKLTREPFPRLSIVTAVRDDRALHVGPVRSRSAAERFAEAIHDAMPLRQCTDRITTTKGRPPCILKDLGRCGAPCDGSQDVEDYAVVADRYRSAVSGDPAEVLAALRHTMRRHAAEGRFEEAQRDRTRLHHLARVLLDDRRLRTLVGVDELIAARTTDAGTEVVLVQRGRLAGSCLLPHGSDGIAEAVRRLRTTAPSPPDRGAPDRDEVEEIRLVDGWLRSPGVRVVSVRGQLAEPIDGGRMLHEAVGEARRVERAVRRDRQRLRGAKVVRRD
ncbi:MAG: DEDD exonuclease domain-containing protein [Actinobacteria bacterium]|nr:DEDD exonuclease domain-containing protein [Actinomycetota bacterium]